MTEKQTKRQRYYYTPDNSKFEVDYTDPFTDELSAVGVIVESHIQAQIGIRCIFTRYFLTEKPTKKCIGIRKNKGVTK